MMGAYYFLALIFILLFSGKIISSDIRYFVDPLIRQCASENYLSVTGKVTQSNIYSLTNSKGVIKYRINIRYEYQAYGQKLEAHRFRYFDDSMYVEDINLVKEITTTYPIGSQVKVFYNPQNPTDALLSPGIVGDDIAPLFKSLSFLYIVLIIGGICLLRLWRAVFSPLAGGVKIIYEAQLVHVQLPWFSPMAIAIITGISSLVGRSLLPSQRHMSLVIAVTELLSNLGIIVLVYFWLRYKIQSGDYNLDIHKDSGTVVLPKKFGHKDRLTLKISEISAVTVEVNVSGGKNISYTFSPALRLHGKDTKLFKLANWNEPKRAEDFAAWLRRQLGLPEINNL